MTATRDEYNQMKTKFFKKHKQDFQIYTTPMSEYGTWSKTYVFADNAQWTECYDKVVEKHMITSRGCDFEVELVFFRTEFYSTESKSYYYYERY